MPLAVLLNLHALRKNAPHLDIIRPKMVFNQVSIVFICFSVCLHFEGGIVNFPFFLKKKKVYFGTTPDCSLKVFLALSSGSTLDGA